MTQFSVVSSGYFATFPNDKSLLCRARTTLQNGTRPAIICLPGHGANGFQSYGPQGVNTFLGGYHFEQLAEAGYIMLAIDDATTAAPEWGDAVAMSALDAAYTLATTTLGAKAGRVGLMGYSMGGLAMLNWIKRNPTKVAAAWGWAPLSDLDWANSTAAYVPTYGSALPNNAGWSTEIGVAYNPYATASVGFRVRDEYASWAGLNIPIKCCHASDDTTLPIAQNQVGFVPGVNDPQVTMRTPIPTGNHTGMFIQIPPAEVIAFFKARLPF